MPQGGRRETIRRLLIGGGLGALAPLGTIRVGSYAVAAAIGIASAILAWIFGESSTTTRVTGRNTPGTTSRRASAGRDRHLLVVGGCNGGPVSTPPEDDETYECRPEEEHMDQEPPDDRVRAELGAAH